MDNTVVEEPEIKTGPDPGFGSVRTKTTRQEEILMHLVSDWELNEVAQSRTSRLENMLWAMVGAAVGAAIPALEEFYRAFWATPATAMTGLGLVKILVFAITAALAIGATLVMWHKEKSGKDLLDEIRKRPTC
jgi:hypothetical protein